MSGAWFNHAFEAPLLPEAQAAMLQILREMGAGPLAPRRAEEVLCGAREAVARLLAADPDEVLLTSGGTEACNLALKGTAEAGAPGSRLIASSVEQLPVLHPLRSLARRGHDVVLLPVDGHGRVDPADLERELRKEAALISMHHGNREVGTLQPVRELGRLAQRHGVPLHLDLAASAGLAAVPPDAWGADLLSLSGLPLGAPAGTGALWVREGTRLLPLIEGGNQEGGLRAGAVNVLGAAGLAAACRAASGSEVERAGAVRRLRDRLEVGLQASIPDCRRQGAPADGRLPGHLSLAFPGAEGEALLFRLRRARIEASSGSTCASEVGKPSPVLAAMGIAPAVAQCSVLFSLGPASREDEVELALQVMPGAVAALREIGGKQPARAG